MPDENITTTEKTRDAVVVAPAPDPVAPSATPDPAMTSVPSVVDAPAQSETPAESEPAASVETDSDVVLPEAGEPVAPTETAVSEPAVVEAKEKETAPETIAVDARSESTEAVEESNAPHPPLKVRGGDDGGVMGEESGVTETPLPPKEPPVKEVIIEKEKPLTDADKDRIFREKLKGNLEEANRQKHAQFETNLQEIVDFIRSRGTLVTNQDIEEGLKQSDTTVTNRLNELIRRDLIVRVGDQRHAKYKLTQAV
jgi:uncharacterized membrane protein